MNKNNQDNFYKDLKVFLFLVSLAIMLIISILYLNSISFEYVCDSTSSHDFVNEDSDRIPNEGVVFKISSVYNSFKRRLSWYALDKDTGRYNSYDEYKKTWNTNTRIWDIIKADFKKSQAEAWARRRRTNAYDHQVWEIRWARRDAEDQERNERRKAAYEYRNK